MREMLLKKANDTLRSAGAGGSRQRSNDRSRNCDRLDEEMTDRQLSTSFVSDGMGRWKRTSDVWLLAALVRLMKCQVFRLVAEGGSILPSAEHLTTQTNERTEGESHSKRKVNGRAEEQRERARPSMGVWNGDTLVGLPGIILTNGEESGGSGRVVESADSKGRERKGPAESLGQGWVGLVDKKNS